MGASLTDCSGRMLFFRAVEKGDLETVKQNVERIGSLDFHDEGTGYSPLMAASVVGRGDFFTIAKILLENNASVDLKDNKGQTSLFLASLGGHIDLVKLLIKRGADINIVTNEGYSPFYAACWRNRLEVAKVLHKAGANANHEAPDGTNALSIAKEWSADKVVKYLEDSLKLEHKAKAELAISGMQH
mmetsp:Transcript_19567/g.31061  ORF Transcript_19567/g.31061 Transcript_19567/m.31061 type:complete len:187 (-) Transcript_19567:98-658(-)